MNQSLESSVDTEESTEELITSVGIYSVEYAEKLVVEDHLIEFLRCIDN